MSVPPAPDEDEDDGQEWQVSLEDLEDDDQPAESPIQPGSPSLENTAFVVLGVLLTLYVLFGGF